MRNFLFEIRSPTARRALASAIMAPPLAMLIYGLSLPLLMGTASGPFWPPLTLDNQLAMAAMTCLFGTLFAYAGMMLVGLPTVLILKSLQAEMGLFYLLVGALSLPALLTFNSGRFDFSLAPILTATAPGFLVAGIWWRLASR